MQCDRHQWEDAGDTELSQGAPKVKDEPQGQQCYKAQCFSRRVEQTRKTMAKIPSYPGSPQPGVLTVLLPKVTFSSVLDEVLGACSDRVTIPKHLQRGSLGQS